MWQESPVENRQRKGPSPIRYDADQKLLAFGGTLSLVFGALFWGLLGARFVASGGIEEAIVAFALAGTAAVLSLIAWGLRTRMHYGEPLNRAELNWLTGCALILGVLIGFLVFLALRYKLEDPGIFHVAGEPEDTPPALR